MKNYFLFISLVALLFSSIFNYAQPNNITQAKQIFDLFLEAPDLETEARYIKEIYNLAPNSEYGDFVGGYLDLVTQKYQNALINFNKAIEKNKDIAGFYLWRGKCYHFLQNYNNAVNDLTKYIQLNPKSGQGYYTRGEFYLIFKEYQLAIKDYTTAISLNYKLSNSYLQRAWNLAQLDKNKEALLDYNKSIQIDPNNSVAYRQRGINKIILYMKADGCKDLKKSAELGDEEANKHIYKFCR